MEKRTKDERLTLIYIIATSLVIQTSSLIMCKLNSVSQFQHLNWILVLPHKIGIIIKGEFIGEVVTIVKKR